jgi:hypothetical protein
MGFLSDFADRLRSKAAIRGRRDFKLSAEKSVRLSTNNRDWHGEPIDSHTGMLPARTLAAVMAAVGEWNGADRESVRGAMRRSLLILPAEELPGPTRPYTCQS